MGHHSLPGMTLLQAQPPSQHHRELACLVSNTRFYSQNKVCIAAILFFFKDFFIQSFAVFRGTLNWYIWAWEQIFPCFKICFGTNTKTNRRRLQICLAELTQEKNGEKKWRLLWPLTSLPVNSPNGDRLECWLPKSTAIVKLFGLTMYLWTSVGSITENLLPSKNPTEP